MAAWKRKTRLPGIDLRPKTPLMYLRKSMTEEERKLWYQFLRTYSVKWYRQRPIDKYIVDFYCSKAKLIVELDGSQHYQPDGVASDEIRTDKLEQYGLKVLRFSNLDVQTHFYEVCTLIDQNVKERLKTV